MSKLAIFASLFIPLLLVPAAPPDGPSDALGGGVTLTVEITGFAPARGAVLVQISASEPEYAGKRPPTARRSVPVTGDTVTVTFEGLPPGDYAVSVAHDENGNGEMDRNFLGVPKEAYGFSGDAPAGRGRPAFDAVKIPLRASAATVRIRLARYGAR